MTTTHRLYPYTLKELDERKADDWDRNASVRELTLAELGRQLREVLAAAGKGIPDHEGLSSCYQWSQVRPPRVWGPIPPLYDTTRLAEIRYRWIAVFPVTGANEGHYIHVDLIWQAESTEGRIPLFQLKTFAGHEAAITLAGILCRVLGV